MFQKNRQPEHGTPGGYGASGSSNEPKHSPTPAESAPNPNRTTATETMAGAATVLAEGSKFVGKANVAGTFRVEGAAEGTIETADTLVVGSTGGVQADVQVRRAVVNGRFEGKITAREGVEFQSGSQVEADVKAKNMVMEDGVRFSGNCEIGG
ncbi:MAG TPA: polymer-forming cytoskeletal protein [bacterium]|nr:polymer-forming cytoskeletal protein [bacterium]